MNFLENRREGVAIVSGILEELLMHTVSIPLRIDQMNAKSTNLAANKVVLEADKYCM